jgi:hypothetical protein
MFLGLSTRQYNPKQYSQGVLELADKVRAAIQSIKPDAVLMGETTAGPRATRMGA